jgi:hypothetical protein
MALEGSDRTSEGKFTRGAEVRQRHRSSLASEAVLHFSLQGSPSLGSKGRCRTIGPAYQVKGRGCWSRPT